MMFIGTFFSLCSTHWLGVWLGLEINLMGFIPIMVQSSKSEEVESGIKYFLTQAIASALLLVASLMMFWKFGSWGVSSLGIFMNSSLVLSSLLLKLGMSPFHFWVPGVVSGLSWFCNILLLTWQKVAPMLVICFFFSLSKELLFVLILLSSFFGGVGGVNQTSIRALLSYSSILHGGWMLSSMVISLEVACIYLLLYSTILIFILGEFLNQESKTNKQFNNIFLWNTFSRMAICFMILSMGGMPPMIGFFMKWMVLSILISVKMVLVSAVLIVGSVIGLYYYLILMFSILVSCNSNWKYLNYVDMKLMSWSVFFNFSGLSFIFWLWSFI
uniref:NADH-ubiquinone oxidoreductase chain 2 n=1 Tax=Lepidozona coreanica TaxID=55527 RepID=A0A6G9DW68_9MOLL|nr:NADH dehydrogenase subunit 2 [Lepidozona coreanica]QIP53378.1 NADH dehydrogenase subunit 2 [Lepidozona coreanica]